MQQQKKQEDTQQPEATATATTDSLQVPESTTEPTKTFEAGFFRVSSPVRSPAYHCEGKIIYSKFCETKHYFRSIKSEFTEKYYHRKRKLLKVFLYSSWNTIEE